jgi:hypothetical protein
MSIWGEAVHVRETRTTPLNNDRSTSDTIHQMIQLANSSASSPDIRSILNQCIDKAKTSTTGKPSLRDLVRCIFWWVKGHVRFEEDEIILAKAYGVTMEQISQVGGIDMIISPIALVRMPQPMGDCDCFSTLLASLLICAHIPCWFITICADELEPMRWSHVYCMAWLNDERRGIILDASHGSYPGWETDKEKFRKVAWRVN